jgi:hypothetical protein
MEKNQAKLSVANLGMVAVMLRSNVDDAIGLIE